MSGDAEESGEETRTKRMLLSAFRGLLRPQDVDDLKITHEDARTVSGFIRTRCPVEKASHLEDFEAHLDVEGGQGLRYVLVDGRKLVGPNLERQATEEATRSRIGRRAKT